MKPGKYTVWLLLGLVFFGTGCAMPAVWAKRTHRPVLVSALMLSPATTNFLVLYEEECVTNVQKHRSGSRTARACLLANLSHPASMPAFVDVTNLDGWISVPVGDLNFHRPPPQYREIIYHLSRCITNSEDLSWAEGNDAGRLPQPPYVMLGTNIAGTRIFITNAPPVRGYYMVLPQSPLGRIMSFTPRYVVLDEMPPINGCYAATLSDRITIWRDGCEEETYTLPTYSAYVRNVWWRIALTPFAAVSDAFIIEFLVPPAALISQFPLVHSNSTK